jgi:antitoxin component of RelBE/YafQ-DinJ toxin-antitoxin module
MRLNLTDPMRKSKTKNTVQVSFTMERELKQRYAKLALEMDLSLSQLIRLALRKLEESKRE